MYIPSHFKEKDPEKIRTFIRQHSFGTLVSILDNRPWATHLPVELVRKQTEEYVLHAHVSKANPQWKNLRQEQEIMVIFQGAQGYISPRFYDHVNVPTMNYLAVHVYGTPRLIEDFDELHALLKGQVEKYEDAHAEAFRIESLPEPMPRAHLNGLVGIEIAITQMEASFKLSQNRDEANYRSILHEIEQRQQPGDATLLEEMRQVYDQKGYRKE